MVGDELMSKERSVLISQGRIPINPFCKIQSEDILMNGSSMYGLYEFKTIRPSRLFCVKLVDLRFWEWPVMERNMDPNPTQPKAQPRFFLQTCQL